MKRYLILIAAAALAGSCTVMRQSNYREATSRIIEPKQAALIVPLKGDIEVLRDGSGAFIKASETITYDLKKMMVSINECKKFAVNEVARKYNADLLVGVLIDVEQDLSSKKKTKKNILNIHVSGYPAVFTKFRNIDASDEAVMKFYSGAMGGEITVNTKK